jgi:hypothetical protein
MLAEEIGYNPNKKNLIGFQVGYNFTQNLALFNIKIINDYTKFKHSPVFPGGIKLINK